MTNKTKTPAERNGRKTLTTVQGIPKKFSRKKILTTIKKQFGRSFLFQLGTLSPNLASGR